MNHRQREGRTLRTVLLAPFVATVAGVLAITIAPAVASAEPPTCRDRGGASVCQKPGHAFVHSEPPPVVGMPTGSGLFDTRLMPGFGRATGVAPIRG